MIISFLFFQSYSVNAMHHDTLNVGALIGGGTAAILLGANCCKHLYVAEPKEENKPGQDEERHFKKDEPIKTDEQPIRRIVRTESNGSDKSSNESVSSTKAVVHTDEFTESKSNGEKNEKLSDESRRNDSVRNDSFAERKKFSCFPSMRLCQKKDHCHHNFDNTVDFIKESLQGDTSTQVETPPDARILAREQFRNGSQAKDSDQRIIDERKNIEMKIHDPGTEANNTREGNNSHQLAETLCNAAGCVNTALSTTGNYALAGAKCVRNRLVSAATAACNVATNACNAATNACNGININNCTIGN